MRQKTSDTLIKYLCVCMCLRKMKQWVSVTLTYAKKKCRLVIAHFMALLLPSAAFATGVMLFCRPRFCACCGFADLAMFYTLVSVYKLPQ